MADFGQNDQVVEWGLDDPTIGQIREKLDPQVNPEDVSLPGRLFLGIPGERLASFGRANNIPYLAKLGEDLSAGYPSEMGEAEINPAGIVRKPGQFLLETAGGLAADLVLQSAETAAGAFAGLKIAGPPGAIAGGLLGRAHYSFSQAYDSIKQQQKAAGRDSEVEAIIGGALSAGLDTMGPVSQTADKLARAIGFKGRAEVIKEILEATPETLKKYALKAAGKEAATEAAQTQIESYAGKHELAGAGETAYSAIAGGLGGGVVGGVQKGLAQRSFNADESAARAEERQRKSKVSRTPVTPEEAPVLSDRQQRINTLDSLLQKVEGEETRKTLEKRKSRLEKTEVLSQDVENLRKVFVQTDDPAERKIIADQIAALDAQILSREEADTKKTEAAGLKPRDPLVQEREALPAPESPPSALKTARKVGRTITVNPDGSIVVEQPEASQGPVEVPAVGDARTPAEVSLGNEGLQPKQQMAPLPEGGTIVPQETKAEPVVGPTRVYLDKKGRTILTGEKAGRLAALTQGVVPLPNKPGSFIVPKEKTDEVRNSLHPELTKLPTVEEKEETEIQKYRATKERIFGSELGDALSSMVDNLPDVPTPDDVRALTLKEYDVDMLKDARTRLSDRLNVTKDDASSEVLIDALARIDTELDIKTKSFQEVDAAPESVSSRVQVTKQPNGKWVATFNTPDNPIAAALKGEGASKDEAMNDALEAYSRSYKKGLEESIKTKNLNKIMDTVASVSTEFKSILSELKTALGENYVDVSVNRVNENAKGNPIEENEKGITHLNPSGSLTIQIHDLPGHRGLRAETVAHELVHAATVSRVAIGRRPNAPLELKAAVADLDRLAMVVKKLLKGHQYAKTLGRGEELQAYGLTRPDVQAFLKATPDPLAKKKTLWDKFLDILSRLFGKGGDTNFKNALERLVDITKKITTADLEGQTFADGEGSYQMTNKDESPDWFKRWFEGSKVVDGDGNPRKVYHGTLRGSIDEFKVSKSGSLGAGIYFAGDPSFASQYARGFGEGGNVMPVYLAIKKPLVIEGSGHPMVMALQKLGMDKEKAFKKVENLEEEFGYVGKQISSLAQKQGYDGIMQLRDGKLAEVVVFNKDQIRSVYNEGTPDNSFQHKDSGDDGKAPGMTPKEILRAYSNARIKLEGMPDGKARRDVEQEIESLEGLAKARGIDLRQHEHDEPDTSSDTFQQRDLDSIEDPQERLEATSEEASNMIGRGYDYVMRSIRSSADFMKKTPGLEALGKAVQNHIDGYQKYRGAFNDSLSNGLKQLKSLSRKDRLEVEKQFAEYMRAFQQGDKKATDEVLATSRPELEALVEAAHTALNIAGDLTAQKGVFLFDSVTGKFRPFQKRANFFPNILKVEYRDALNKPFENDGVTYRPEFLELAGHLIKAKYKVDGKVITTPADAEKYISKATVEGQFESGFFGNIERARTMPFPPEVYDNTLAALEKYRDRWAERMGQIEAYGQEIPGKQQDLFGKTLSELPVRDPRADYVQTLQKRVYGDRETAGLIEQLAQTASTLATGLQISGIKSVFKNTVGGIVNAYQFMDVDVVNKAWGELMTQDGREAANKLMTSYGVIQDDFLRSVADLEVMGLTPYKGFEKAKRGISDFTNQAMSLSLFGPLSKISFNSSEAGVRTLTGIAAKYQLAKYINEYNNDPNSKDASVLKKIAQDENINLDALLKEFSKESSKESGVQDMKSSPETARFIRRMVNRAQGSYRLDQVPLWMESPVGRFIFKYTKYGVQLGRMFDRTVIENIRSEDTNLRKEGWQNFGKYMSLYGTAGYLTAELLKAGWGDELLPDWEEFGNVMAGKIKKGEEMDAAVYIARTIFTTLNVLGAWGPLSIVNDKVNQYQNYGETPLSAPGLGVFINLVKSLNKTFKGIEHQTLGNAVQDSAKFLFDQLSITSQGTKLVTNVFGKPNLLKARADVGFVRQMQKRWAMAEPDVEIPAHIDPRYSEFSILNKRINDAILLGQPEKAKAAKLEALSRYKAAGDRKRLEASVRASVAIRRPMAVRMKPSGKAGMGLFREWAKANLPQDKYQRIIDIDKAYMDAAIKAGLIERDSDGSINKAINEYKRDSVASQ